MQRITTARRIPFLLVAAIALMAAVALFRLPEEFVAGMKRDRPLDSVAAGWLFRLLALAAFAQAAYTGLVILRPEKVLEDRRRDSKLAGAPAQEVVRVLARNAAGIAALTLAYGFGSFLLTGERAGVWLFLAIFVAQMAWYYRQTGKATELIAQSETQPEPRTEEPRTEESGG